MKFNFNKLPKECRNHARMMCKSRNYRVSATSDIRNTLLLQREAEPNRMVYMLTTGPFVGVTFLSHPDRWPVEFLND